VLHRRIIKRGPVVLATREDGTMDPGSASSQGLFLADTRYLSMFQIRLNGCEILLLGSTEDSLFQAWFLHANPELDGIPERGIGLLQHNTIEEGAVRIEITAANWSLERVELDLTVEMGADFFDSFEARGVKRTKRGTFSPVKATKSSVDLEYLGCDDVTRITHIMVKPEMASYDDGYLHFPCNLDVNQRHVIDIYITMEQRAPEGVNVQPEPTVAREPKPEWFDRSATITTDNARINAIVQRSVDDIEVLLTEWDHLWVPAAGLPRFAVPFGRDCLITGIETLMWNDRLSRDVLLFLAKTQGKEENPWNYEQPGKIMHEMHTGELARLREVPFGLFYGSVDSTPLFLVLAGEYIRWTGDVDLYTSLESNIDRAWDWIDKYGDIDGSGYLQYQAHTPPKASSAALTVGLFNQGWKDSSRAVMYGDGTMVTDHPVALAEVQGYYYRALHLWAGVYDTLPQSEAMEARARRCEERAARLKEQFNREFWMPDKNFFAMGLDGHHRHIDSITSNPGHCFWSRLIDEELAEPAVKTLMSESMFTAWGIRTMAETEPAFNPFSYHNGSIWPFENALIASGLKKYGYVLETQQILDSLVEASLYFEYRRWPEVYCGVRKAVGGVLARQPDASRPQAWSAGAIFLFLQTILGIASPPFADRVDVTPVLPSCLQELIVDDIPIKGGKLGLRLIRDGNSVLLEVRANPGDLDVVVHPACKNHHHLRGPDMPAVSH
jgi:glycogen debranching enzyme